MNPLKLGIDETFTFTKTVGESDVYLFAGITGDLHSNHVNEHLMKKSPFGGRIAHGALLIGYVSACSTMACERGRDDAETPVSIGYDKIRLLAPVKIGDTITVTYKIVDVDNEKRRTRASVEIKNQDDKLVVVGDHILKWVPNS